MVAVAALMINPGVVPSALPFVISTPSISPPALLSRLEAERFVMVPSSMVPELSISPSAVSSLVIEPSSDAIF